MHMHRSYQDRVLVCVCVTHGRPPPRDSAHQCGLPRTCRAPTGTYRNSIIVLQSRYVAVGSEAYRQRTLAFMWGTKEVVAAAAHAPQALYSSLCEIIVSCLLVSYVRDLPRHGVRKAFSTLHSVRNRPWSRYYIDILPNRYLSRSPVSLCLLQGWKLKITSLDNPVFKPRLLAGLQRRSSDYCRVLSRPLYFSCVVGAITSILHG